MTGHVASRRALSRPVQTERDRVAAWMAQRARPSADGGAVGIESLYEDYREASTHGAKATQRGVVGKPSFGSLWLALGTLTLRVLISRFVNAGTARLGPSHREFANPE